MWCPTCGSELPSERSDCPRCGHGGVLLGTGRSLADGTLPALIGGIVLIVAGIVALVLIVALRNEPQRAASGDPPVAEAVVPLDDPPSPTGGAAPTDSPATQPEPPPAEPPPAEPPPAAPPPAAPPATQPQGDAAPVMHIDRVEVLHPVAHNVSVSFPYSVESPGNVEFGVEVVLLSDALPVTKHGGAPLGYRGAIVPTTQADVFEVTWHTANFPPGDGLYTAQVTVSYDGAATDTATSSVFPVNNLLGLELDGLWTSSLQWSMYVTTQWGPEPLPSYQLTTDTGQPLGTMGFFAWWDLATVWGQHADQLGTTAHIVGVDDAGRPNHIRTDTGVQFWR